MRTLIATAVLACSLMGGAAHAGQVTVYEWEEVAAGEDATTGSGRYVSGVPLEDVAGIATYGPFRVIDGNRAALVGITDHRSPQAFSAMLRDHPGLATLDLIECPGTFDDLANLELGRLIRNAGLATHVPDKGSVRSGAVELFLAGARRSIDDGARFAVHAWEDDSGMEATDYALDAPESRRYLSYYREMGMSEQQARAFYAMTNSVPFESALWLSAGEMRGWTGDQPAQAQEQVQAESAPVADAAPRLAYLDLGALLN